MHTYLFVYASWQMDCILKADVVDSGEEYVHFTTNNRNFTEAYMCNFRPLELLFLFFFFFF